MFQPLTFILLNVIIMDKHSLTRTCIACGLDKPLAAFLQLTGAQGTVYGSICSTCRALSKKEKAEFNEDEQSGGGSSGLRIDSKRKVKMDQDKKEFSKKTEELFIEEAKQDDELKKDKLDRTEKKYQTEKEHRITYIDSKKQRFLSYQDKKSQSALAKKRQDTQLITDYYQTIEAQTVEQSYDTEVKTKATDLSTPFIDPQFGQLPQQNPVFQKMKSAPLMRILEQLYLKKRLDTSRTHKLTSEKSQALFEKQKKEVKKDFAVDVGEKHKPSSGRHK